MRSALARLFVEMRLRNGNVDKGLQKTRNEVERTDRSFGKLGSVIGKVGSVAGGFILANVVQKGLSAVVGSIGNVINAGSDMAESASKASTVFGKGYAEIEQAAKGAAFSVGLTKGAYMEAAGTLGNLLKGVGVAQSELPKMSKNIIAAAGDLGSFNNVDPSQVLEDLRSGLVGEAEPLRKYGILINEAAVQAKGLELGLTDANGELSEGAKVQARYALIMDQMGDASGDFSKTQFGLANGTRILKALFGTFQIWLGSKLAPTIGRVVKYVNQFIKAFMDLRANGVDPVSAAFMALRQLLTKGKDSPTRWSKLTEKFEKALRRVASYWDDLVDVVKTGGRIFMRVVGFIADKFDIIGPAVLGAVVAVKAFAAAQKIAAIASALLNLSLSPMMIVILAIAAVGAFLAIAWAKNWFDIRGKTKAAIEAITKFLRPLIDLVVQVGKYFYDVATGKIQPLGESLERFPGWLQPIIYVLARVIKTVRVFFKTWADKGFLAALKTIPMQIRAFGRAVARFLESIGLERTAEAVKKTFYDLASLFRNVVSLVDNLVHGRWKAVWQDLKNIAVDLFNLFIDRFKMAGALLLDIFTLIPWGTIGSALVTGITTAASFMATTGFPWLWTKTKELFGAITGALGEWWETSAAPWLKGLGRRFVRGIGDVSETLGGKGRGLVRGLLEGARGLWTDTVWPWIKSIPGSIAGAVGDLWSAGWNWGWSLITGLAAGIQSVWNKLTGWVDKILEQWERIPKKLRPGSPSKWATAIGKSVPWGLAEGVKKTLPMLTRAMGTVNDTFGMSMGAGQLAAATPGGTSSVGRVDPKAAVRVNQFAPRSIIVENHAENGNKVARDILDEIFRIEETEL